MRRNKRTGGFGKTRERAGRAGQRIKIKLRWFLKKLGAENVTSLLVEGGGRCMNHFSSEGWRIA